MSDRQPTDIEAIREAIESLRTEIRTVMPAEVVRYNAATQRADVQPLIRCRTIDGKTRDIPQVSSAPVLWPRFAGFDFQGELEPGDTVTLLVADRSLDKWRQTGGRVDPVDTRKHEVNDALVLPSLWPDVNPIKGRIAGELRIGREDGTAALRINKTGGVTIEAAVEIKLGKAATEALVKGSAFALLFNFHTHSGVTPGPGASGVPVVPMTSPAHLSTKTKTE